MPTLRESFDGQKTPGQERDPQGYRFQKGGKEFLRKDRKEIGGGESE